MRTEQTPASHGTPKRVTCYVDFISPYAYLAFEQLPRALKGLSYSVNYKPVLFAALLKHHGQLGPAEIASKREWTYRHVQWLARSLGVDLQLPASHPFNPLPLLRLAIACSPLADLEGPNRYVCEKIFHHVWRGGAQADDAQRLAVLTQQLAPVREPQAEEVKTQLKRNTQEAMGCGVFGVPSFVVDGLVFWGLEALPMLRDYLQGDAWFAGDAWHGVHDIHVGVKRS